MVRLTIVISILLMGLGGGVYVWLAFTDPDPPSKTALIPAFVGLPLFFLAILSAKESLRMHAMHGVAVLALLGTLAPLGRLAMQLAKGKMGSSIGVASLLAMAGLCGGLLWACIQSFRAARRNRQPAQP